MRSDMTPQATSLLAAWLDAGLSGFETPEWRARQLDALLSGLRAAVHLSSSAPNHLGVAC